MRLPFFTHNKTFLKKPGHMLQLFLQLIQKIRSTRKYSEALDCCNSVSSFLTSASIFYLTLHTPNLLTCMKNQLLLSIIFLISICFLNSALGQDTTKQVKNYKNTVRLNLTNPLIFGDRS